jgi:hypothetical protein
MSLFSNKQPPEQSPVDLDELEDTIKTYNDRSAAQPRRPVEKPQPTRLQIIGHAVTTLTWAEAEAMGRAIEAKLSIEDGRIMAKTSLTAAIQDWAKDWETFA